MPLPLYEPPISFPQRSVKAKIKEQLKTIDELLKKLHINIPFTKSITQMPLYTKFLQEILTNKRKIDANGTEELTEGCNAIIQNKMAIKMKDLVSLSIPHVIDNHIIDKTLCDLGASVCLMPLSIFKRLNIGELKPTKMSIYLDDQSIKYPVGIMEEVPLRISQLHIPTDFMVMDINEDARIANHLGRPFLAIAGTIIDVKRGKLTLEVGDEKIEFL